jgi:hypothetical protein
MIFGLFLAALASPAQTKLPPQFTARAEWRLCTRESALGQLKSRRASLDHESVVEKAFNDCAEKLKAASRTQSPEDIRRLQEEQRGIIKQDVEMFYWDNMTGHI